MANLGDEVVDLVSGFKGIITGKSEFLNGCARVCVQPKVGKDGKHPESMWFDDPQVKVTSVRKVKRGPVDTGGPMPSIPTRNKGA